MAECLVSVSKALGSTKRGEGKYSYLFHGNFRADPWEVRPGWSCERRKDYAEWHSTFRERMVSMELARAEARER